MPDGMNRGAATVESAAGLTPRKERGAGRVLEDAEARATLTKMVPEQREQQPSCAKCSKGVEGELFLYPTERALDGGETVSLCAECFSHKGVDEDSLVVTRQHAGSPPESADERFEALTTAARVLLRKRISDEDKIIPTLKLAHKRGWRAPKILYNAVRLVEVAEGVPILERTGLTANLHKSLKTGVPSDITIGLFPRKRVTPEKELSDAYEKVLRNEGLDWDRHGGQFTYDFHDYYLLLRVEQSWFSKQMQGGWPPPRLVGRVARATLKEFSERLVIRQSGGEMKQGNLISAMVAYLMSHSLLSGTEVADQKEIHRLLNNYVLCETPRKRLLPEGSYGSTSEVVQLKRDIKKIAQMEERIPDRGPYEIK